MSSPPGGWPSAPSWASPSSSAAGVFAAYRLVDIPAANAAATAQSNVYLYRDGSVIARDGDVNREKVKLSQVPRASGKRSWPPRTGTSTPTTAPWT